MEFGGRIFAWHIRSLELELQHRKEKKNLAECGKV